MVTTRDYNKRGDLKIYPVDEIMHNLHLVTEYSSGFCNLTSRPEPEQINSMTGHISEIAQRTLSQRPLLVTFSLPSYSTARIEEGSVGLKIF